ncbi:MAG: transcription termination factor Rho, partial [Chlamydiae bacterium]|nr:transcription termination factor Rho [Chlamydiota bacterium]
MDKDTTPPQTESPAMDAPTPPPRIVPPPITQPKKHHHHHHQQQQQPQQPPVQPTIITKISDLQRMNLDDL